MEGDLGVGGYLPSVAASVSPGSVYICAKPATFSFCCTASGATTTRLLPVPKPVSELPVDLSCHDNVSRGDGDFSLAADGGLGCVAVAFRTTNVDEMKVL